MDIHLSEAELEEMRPLEENCSRHLSIVNDIYSWEKEVESSLHGHKEGSAICSAVKVMANSAGLDIEASKRVLWPMVREWELLHEKFVYEATARYDDNCPQRLRDYMTGLQYQMSGNELWSRTTLRYSVKS